VTKRRSSVTDIFKAASALAKIQSPLVVSSPTLGPDSESFPKTVTGTAELLGATRANDVWEMSRLLDEHKKSYLTVNSCDPLKRTAMHEAAKAGHVTALKFLISRGANVSPKDVSGNTPLDEAINCSQLEAQQTLSEAGAKLGNEAQAAARLINAVKSNDLDLAKSMVKGGTNIDHVDDDGRTSIHHAVALGSISMIEYLIEAGVKLDVADRFGLTPLGEAARHASRTGENKIHDLLVAAGADENFDGEERKNTWVVFGVLAAMQILFFVLYASTTKFGERPAHQPSESTNALRSTYSMYMDVHVMIFIGFGFLMTFLRKYGHSSIGLNFLLGALTIQWAMLCGGFWEQVFGGSMFHKIGINLNSLLLADFAAAAVLITFGALLGKVTPLQMVVIAFLEVIFFGLNEQLLLQIGILDVGGSIIVHLFGAYFGLAASRVLRSEAASGAEDNASVYHSDLFAMVGSVFLWVYWPSFVSAPAGADDQERAIIATVMALAGSCFSAFMASYLLRRGKFNMVDVQNATLAGGVAIGSAANIVVLSPAESLLIGVIGGLLSVIGYVKVQPRLEKTLKIHDTCGVHNLHGMPAVLAGIASAIVVSYSGEQGVFVTYASQSAWNNAYNSGQIAGRSAGMQAGFQLLCVVVSFAMAVICGALSGLVAKFMKRVEDNELFIDSRYWEVPNFETPFYFDRRGEINRETLSTAVETSLSKHAGTMYTPEADRPVRVPAASSPVQVTSQSVASTSLISNELINMKLDLMLQRLIPQVGSGESAQSKWPVAQNYAPVPPTTPSLNGSDHV